MTPFPDLIPGRELRMFGPSVNRYGGVDQGPDCWRTWFLEECEEHKLFGITQKHLGLVRLSGPSVSPYHVGTRLFLEDAPYFHKTRDTHRLCGPYVVQATDRPPDGSTPEHIVNGNIIVFLNPHPENGPWVDRSRVRNIEGLSVRFRQTASRYGFFPFRFSIHRARDFRVECIEHLGDCWLCR